MRWILYDDPNNIDLETLSIKYTAVHESVGRLRFDPTKPRAKGPIIPANEVEAYVAAEMVRSHYDYRREISPHIHPPPSTKSDRKRRGHDTGILSRDWTTPTLWLQSAMPLESYELRDYIARTPSEEQIYDRLMDGYTYREIASELGVTKHRISATVDLFRRRATQL